ncbi:DUF1217 domain-containing protein [Methylocella sp.]|uniref:DUF1217 domain-containing protein n=1 Tax=Methylocella sp. TaxID=1978226 RepID=UPI003784BA24
MNATLTYTMLAKDFSKSLARTASDPIVKRETAYFEKTIGSIRSVDDFMKNQRVYAYALKAFGLSDMAYARGMIRKVLEQGASDPASLANTLNDQRYKALAKAFDFAGAGAAATGSPDLVATTKADYLLQSLETQVGKENAGAQMALYFRRVAPTVTSAYGLLGDKTLLSVTQTAFGLSPSTSQQTIDRQAKTINSLLKISDLQDPAKLEKLIERFTARYDMKNPGGAATAPVSAMQVTQPEISQNLLMSLANLKLGGV